MTPTSPRPAWSVSLSGRRPPRDAPAPPGRRRPVGHAAASLHGRRGRRLRPGGGRHRVACLRAGGPLLPAPRRGAHPHGNPRLDHAHDHGGKLSAHPHRARAAGLERKAGALAVPDPDGRDRGHDRALLHRHLAGARAGVVALGATLHLINALASLRGVRTWSFTPRLLAVALSGLALTVLFGLALAADRLWKFLPGEFFPTLHAHFRLALLGWVAPMVMGVAARVYPMFLLARDPEGWPGALQLWGLALGSPVVALGLLAVPTLVLPGALAVGAAVAGHLAWVSEMAASRKR